MPRERSNNNNNRLQLGPAGLVVGLLLAKSGYTVEGLIPSATTSFRGYSPLHALPRGNRACVRRRASSGGSEEGDVESSELYADMRRRLQELRRTADSGGRSLPMQEDVSDLGLVQPQQRDGGAGNFPKGGGGAAGGAKVYSAQEMKQRYYEAFWRARNLRKEPKFEVRTDTQDEPSDLAPPITPKAPEAEVASRRPILTTSGLKLFMSGLAPPAAETADPAAESPTGSDVQGLTQMYCLVEKEEGTAAAAAAAVASSSSLAAASAAAVGEQELSPAQAGVAAAALALASPQEQRQQQQQRQRQQVAFSNTGEEATVVEMPAQEAQAVPQGLTQLFFLDPEDEAVATAALPVMPGRSFLRERLGVPGEVVQGLRQVELDHARLAMLAVLLSGAGAGAGVYVSVHDGISSLAEIACTPWLDHYVAGGILAAKALSEGDWRIGKGALAGWADQALSSLSNTGAKVLRLGTGKEIRKLALEMEVKHGRLALGAVVCALAQQGIITTMLA